MKDIQVSIGAANIRTFNYNNNFTAKPGDQMKLAVNTSFAVSLNPASPTVAMVLVKFTAVDEEKKNISLTIETMTPVTVSSFVDNLDEMIKKNYLNEVMIGVGEKVRTLTAITGLNLSVPAIKLPYRDNAEGGSIDSEIYTTRV
ncbi:MAG: hypothetical protein K5987_07760 [Lachnospiraceae bacterium]|jgi:hypothetical protein|nr:hypothetical protein [Lachnospiraceae bacterium]